MCFDSPKNVIYSINAKSLISQNIQHFINHVFIVHSRECEPIVLFVLRMALMSSFHPPWHQGCVPHISAVLYPLTVILLYICKQFQSMRMIRCMGLCEPGTGCSACPSADAINGFRKTASTLKLIQQGRNVLACQEMFWELRLFEDSVLTNHTHTRR